MVSQDIYGGNQNKPLSKMVSQDIYGGTQGNPRVDFDAGSI